MNMHAYECFLRGRASPICSKLFALGQHGREPSRPDGATGIAQYVGETGRCAGFSRADARRCDAGQPPRGAWPTAGTMFEISRGQRAKKFHLSGSLIVTCGERGGPAVRATASIRSGAAQPITRIFITSTSVSAHSGGRVGPGGDIRPQGFNHDQLFVAALVV
jgi:hypothetical protein